MLSTWQICTCDVRGSSIVLNSCMIWCQTVCDWIFLKGAVSVRNPSWNAVFLEISTPLPYFRLFHWRAGWPSILSNSNFQAFRAFHALSRSEGSAMASLFASVSSDEIIVLFSRCLGFSAPIKNGRVTVVQAFSEEVNVRKEATLLIHLLQT